MKSILFIVFMSIGVLGQAQIMATDTTMADSTALIHPADPADSLDTEVAELAEDEEEEPSEEYQAMKKYVEKKILKRNKKVVLMICNGGHDVPDADVVILRRIHRKYLPFDTDCCKYSIWRIVSNEGEFIWTDLNTCQNDLKKSYYTNVSHLHMEEDGENIYLVLKRNHVQLARYRVDTEYRQLYDEKGKIKQQLTTLFKVEGMKNELTVSGL